MGKYENLIAKDNEPMSVRPQRMCTWFTLIPVEEFENDKPEQVLFLDTFVTVKRKAEDDYEVLFEGKEPMLAKVYVGLIMVWYGDDLQTPTREFPKLYDELYPTKYISSKPTIFDNTHIMDFVENGSDNLHFKIVHLWNHSRLYDHEVTKEHITLKQDTRFNYGSCSFNPFIRFMSNIIPELELTA